MADKTKLNLEEVLVGLDTKALKDGETDLTIGKAIATILVMEQHSKDPLRSYLLARKITEGTKDLELDKAEADYIKDAVKETPAYITLVKGQILEKLK